MHRLLGCACCQLNFVLVSLIKKNHAGFNGAWAGGYKYTYFDSGNGMMRNTMKRCRVIASFLFIYLLVFKFLRREVVDNVCG